MIPLVLNKTSNSKCQNKKKIVVFATKNIQRIELVYTLCSLLTRH